ncbi:superoxide dismutase [Halomarina halobia]|uniref:Superoxide dismutase n=1 Tax=Halomarina halobia TaxID=3033386 RepID=A0ABD6AB37_9EURY|nr:superoxide dismutase [Halomarina sp. PSR21]
MTDATESRRDGSTRRTVLRGLGLTAAALGLPGLAAAEGDGRGGDEGTERTAEPYSLPPLPYDYDALEPHIDARIMRLHHDEHHKGYVEGANAALDELAAMRESGEFDRIKAVKRDLSFNLSGHLLHSVFWRIMSPDGGGDPGGDLASALRRDFGSVEGFKREFAAAATGVEGSGWGLLVYDHLAGRLLVTQAEAHNDLAVQGATPLLVLDVWEHAYYLQYENDRTAYVDAFWNVVDWSAVDAVYRAAASARRPAESN